MTRRSSTRRILLAAALTLALPGCKRKDDATQEPTVKHVTLIVRAAANSNAGRPLQVVVRASNRKSFVEDDYAAIARLVVMPDETVLKTLVVFPGQVSTAVLDFDKYPEALGVYGLFNLGKGESWKTLAEQPLELEVVVGEASIERTSVRPREGPSR